MILLLSRKRVEKGFVSTCFVSCILSCVECVEVDWEKRAKELEAENAKLKKQVRSRAHNFIMQIFAFSTILLLKKRCIIFQNCGSFVVLEESA